MPSGVVTICSTASGNVMPVTLSITAPSTSMATE